MNQLKIIILFSFFPLSIFSQNSIENILSEIEKNNTTLAALIKSAEAETIGNKSGIYIPNPEAEFNYLWGSPGNIGNRTDFSIKQSLDFPTAYRFKSQISDLKNEQIVLQYRKELYDIRLQAKILCFDVIYYNALIEELTQRVTYARQIAQSYQSKFDVGETNILEYNKAQLNLLNVSKELESIEINRSASFSELTALNGGKAIDFTESVFQMTEMPEDFEQWYLLAEQKNPAFSWLKNEIEINRNQTGLNRAMSLPKIQAGYMSESVVGQKFQGVTVGLSVPLWENKNKVKYAEANAVALESIATDFKIQFYNHLKALHTKTIALQKNVNDYRSVLKSIDSSELIKTALEKGEISMIDYIVEFSLYYESVNKMLELEREKNKLFAELYQYL